jgi:flagellar basal-body rod protein FlgG
MFTAVTGSTAQQARIDVIANNLANLGTVGFKRMRAQFEDLLYETVRQPAAEGDAPTGLQFGRGTRVVATEQVHAPGTLRNTEQPLDIDPPVTLPSDTLTITIGQDGRIRVTQPGSATPTEVGQIQLYRFTNAGGLQPIGHNLFSETESSGSPLSGSPGEDAFGIVAQGSLEESNVNIAEELVNLILAQRAFEANTRVINTSDEMLRVVTQR